MVFDFQKSVFVDNAEARTLHPGPRLDSTHSRLSLPLPLPLPPRPRHWARRSATRSRSDAPAEVVLSNYERFEGVPWTNVRMDQYIH